MNDDDKGKIKDNPSAKEMLQTLEVLNPVVNFINKVPFANKLIPNLDGITQSLEDINLQSRVLTAPDDFNEIFSSYGWVAYESLSLPLMEEAISVYEERGIEAAERALTDYYDEGTLNSKILRFHGNEHFRKRIRLVDLAKEDYIEGRYHAVIPLLLSLADGLVQDVSAHVGMFAQQSDMTAWDCIAGHSTGLQALVEEIGISRKKTTEEEISLPYRNGILHGRELAFDTKLVAAKCWALLFTARDWAGAISEGKKEPIVKESASLADTFQQIKKNKENRDRLDNWEPRSDIANRDWSKVIASEQLEGETPEKSVFEFMEAWQKEQWGKMPVHLVNFSDKAQGKIIKQVKDDFSVAKILSFSILSVIDERLARSSVTLSIQYEKEERHRDVELVIIVTFSGDDCLSSFDDEGVWRFPQNFFSDIIYAT